MSAIGFRVDKSNIVGRFVVADLEQNKFGSIIGRESDVNATHTVNGVVSKKLLMDTTTILDWSELQFLCLFDVGSASATYTFNCAPE